MNLTINVLLQQFIVFLNALAPFIIALTLLVFIWGLFRMVSGRSEEAFKEAKGTITFAIVALFIMVSVWGLVKILRTSINFGVDPSANPQGPGIPRFK